MSGQLDPRDADPRHVDEDDLWDPQANAWVPRQSGLLTIILSLAFGVIAGILLVLAIVAVAGALTAPRSGALPSIPVAAERQSGAPPAAVSPSLSAARLVAANGGAPSPEVELGTAIEGGILAYAAPSHGSRYLAIPEGPGHRVRICVGGRCLDRVSTDAGPALFRQREGRIADVSFVDFAWLCSCDPQIRGTMPGSIELLGSFATPPPTDTK